MKKPELIFDSLSCFLIIVMTLIIIIRVFMRFFFNVTPSWSEELTSLFMVWVTMIGITIGIRDDKHLSVSLFYDRFPEKFRRIIDIVNHLLILFFVLYVMTYNGIQMVVLTSRSRLSSIPVPNSTLYIMVPVAGFFSTVFIIFIAWKKIRQIKS